MKKTQHTPGPWHIGRRTRNPAIYSHDGAEIAEMLTVTNDDWRDNARLIAAAPDLLAALERAEALLRIAFNPGIDKNVTLCASSCQWAANEARAALAKAQGQEGGAE
jgi:hypothetical protein